MVLICVVSEIHTYPEKWIPSTWWSLYSAKNENNTTLADAAWDVILPALGFVAVSEQWSVERQLPLTMQLPSDTSKRVYILEAPYAALAGNTRHLLLGLQLLIST